MIWLGNSSSNILQTVKSFCKISSQVPTFLTVIIITKQEGLPLLKVYQQQKQYQATNIMFTTEVHGVEDINGHYNQKKSRKCVVLKSTQPRDVEQGLRELINGWKKCTQKHT